MNIVVIGVQDTGKTTLSAGLLLSSNLDKKHNKNTNKVSLLDTNKEEIETGNTSEHTVISFVFNEKKYTIIDTPGQNYYIREMIKGASQAHIALVLLSAKKGDYNNCLKGHVFEHIMIAKAVGINSIIVVVNKMDTSNFDQNIYEYIKNDFSMRIKQFRFRQVKFIPISGEKMLNIFDKYDADWVHESLINAINTIKLIPCEHKMIKPIDNIIKGKLIFHNIDGVITIGFRCIIHCLNNEFEGEIVDISNNVYHYITRKNSQKRIIRVAIKIKSNDLICNRIILRNNNLSIAFGILDN